jgi:hypothetical protein
MIPTWDDQQSVFIFDHAVSVLILYCIQTGNSPVGFGPPHYGGPFMNPQWASPQWGPPSGAAFLGMGYPMGMGMGSAPMGYPMWNNGTQGSTGSQFPVTPNGYSSSCKCYDFNDAVN